MFPTAQKYFASVVELFAKSDWADSPRSMTYNLRDITENHCNHTPIIIYEMISIALIHVRLFEESIHERCRVKEPDAPIHPDPFWYYDGYEYVLGALVEWWKREGCKIIPREQYESKPEMFRIHDFFIQLLCKFILWEDYCIEIEDDLGIRAAKDLMDLQEK
ncbi:hypothetical protein RSOLAG22IIIB_05493 [Rhizoctonia solani]|uniref:Uncharacterized protein n=1 Tax=Rhizoctonia solani TaxID=456999 RepID=A0A0K6G760_9AGAM|nr:hypothetical protein RSOLAG22IIIB_05493 [Rhizoctonia solani]